MAQGTIKLKNPKGGNTKGGKKPSVLGPGPKKGQRQIAPKKADLVKKQKLAKKFSGGLTAKTERNLAEKAGHLELLASAKRREKEGAAGNGKGKNGKN
ncbi:hypothetical protein L228DRAFT_266851 [Xylona heveae TC161]|uniref:Uncharacterized protein n=1 Tax=Xylona heveae (strain CBS 132557 / TC161) TaxID=1328760 RepID=A0A165I864_XYLHT|nr:hypothetical protein L228DRAFT_266851 [Xylona heveae TC161]KZF24523.1 hypothetical protein L228DRAFT_266851 [Xylona heveae TC161]